MRCTWPGAAPLLVGLLTGFLSPGSLASQDERSVRAAYVFNLTKYVEWPPESKQLVIGVIGNRATGEFLKKLLDGRMSGSRPIRLMLSPALAELRDCNILYLADGFAKKTFAAVQDMHLKGMLTLGETDTFPDDGGMIALVRVGDQIHIQLNLEATERGGVKLDSHLLDLASIVSPGTIVAQTSPLRTPLVHPNPVYPSMAAKLLLHGSVRVEVRIGPNGRVRHVCGRKSRAGGCGHQSCHQLEIRAGTWRVDTDHAIQVLARGLLMLLLPSLDSQGAVPTRALGGEVAPKFVMTITVSSPGNWYKLCRYTS